MIAAEYAKHYKIEPQGQDESDFAFRSRVAGSLRDMGKIIEAHEAQQDSRYDNSKQVLSGIVGAVALAMGNIDYGTSGENLVGDEIAAGIFADPDGMSPKRKLRDMPIEVVMLMIELFERKT